MATRLYNALTFTAIAPGVPTSQAHGLNWHDRKMIPDIVQWTNCENFSVVADDTNVTVTNNGAAPADCIVFVTLLHTILRAFGGDQNVVLPVRPLYLPAGCGGGGGGEFLRESVEVNGLVTATTEIFVTAAGADRFIPTMLVLDALNVSAVTLQPEISVGTVAGGDIEIIPLTMISMTATGQYLVLLPNTAPPAAQSTPAATSIRIAVVGGAGAAYTMRVNLWGFYNG